MNRFLLTSVIGLVGTVALSAVGCSDPVSSPPRVIIESKVSGGQGLNCDVSQDWLVLGTSPGAALDQGKTCEENSQCSSNICKEADGKKTCANNAAQPLEQGAKTTDGGTVKIDCKVAKGGDGFDVTAQIQQIGGLNGGTVVVQGKFQEQGEQKVRLVFTKADYGTYQSNECVVRYAPNTPQGVAAGRVWGEFECGAVKKDQSEPERTCTAKG
jgi:hypothetical protein